MKRGIDFHFGNNVAVMKRLCLRDVMLAYLDPPFTTGRTFATKGGAIAYRDSLTRGTWIEHLTEIASQVWKSLDDRGCMVVHLDSRISHYAKVAIDHVFGTGSFASEIVWHYRRWPSKTPNFQRVHDVLLRYRKNIEVEPRWNQLYAPLAPSTVKQWGTTRQRALEVDGRRVRSTRTTDASPGVPLGDVWDIPIIAPSSTERTGYPTQKPRALLERLVLSMTNPGDLVLDPYMGSGTTLVVAQDHRRRAVGIDESEEAIRTTRQRLNKRK